MKYFAAGLFLLAGNEILSLLVLMAMMGMFFWDIAKARLGGDVSPTRSAGAPFRQGGQKGRY